MKYKMIDVNGVWNIVETQTDHVVATIKNKDEAKKRMRNLNFGAVFDGWTPAFFLKNLNNFHQKLSA